MQGRQFELLMCQVVEVIYFFLSSGTEHFHVVFLGQLGNEKVFYIHSLRDDMNNEVFKNT